MRSTKTINALVPVADVGGEHRPLVEGLQILESTSVQDSIPLGLAQNYRDTQVRVQEHKLKTKFLGFAPIFSGNRVYVGNKSDWAIMNLSEDSLYHFHNGNLHAPPSVIKDIKKNADAGVKLDSNFIAHEVPPGTIVEGEPVPLELIIPPPSGTVQRRLGVIDKLMNSWWKTVGRTSATAVATPFVAGAVVTFVAVSAVASVANNIGTELGNRSREIAEEKERIAEANRIAAARKTYLAAGYDPVLLGVQFDPNWTDDENRPIGLWYYLGAWNWDELEQ
jgi:hypothetical protein